MTAEKTLILEKRGCDFWSTGSEKNLSDLENFRLFGHIFPKDVVDSKEKRGYAEVYFIEITTGIQHNRVREGIHSFITVDYEVAPKNCFCSLNKCGGTRNATKEGILKYINTAMGSNFNKLEIVESL